MKRPFCNLYLFSFLLILFNSSALGNLPEKPIVAVITSYNNAQWVTKNLDSVLAQEYNNFRVIYIDDCSSDGTSDIVEQYLHEHNFEHKVTFIRNQRREKKLFNIYNAYHSIDDWDIVIQIDGDDWLAHNQVFNKINKIYSESETWLTYGKDKETNGRLGYSKPVPQNIISSGNFRKWEWLYMPLRTFYAWLFKQIKLQDLLINLQTFRGQFFPYGNDCAIMYPMIEMARYHFKYVSEVLYITNTNNPISNLNMGWLHPIRPKIFQEILNKTCYPALEEPVTGKLEQLENAKADCIIVSYNPEKTHNLLNSMIEHVTHIKNVQIIYQATEQNKNAYTALKNKFSSIRFIDLSIIKWIGEYEAIIKSLFGLLGDYILLADDTYIFKNQVNLNQCIKDLEQTFAYSVYFNLHLINGPFSENNEPDKTPCQRIKDDVYAWKFESSNIQNKLFEENTMSLHRKKDILTFIQNSVNDLTNICKPNSIELVGLFFQEPKIIKQG